MNINDLPDEVLVRILSFLPRSDRLESALTCRRWAQTVAREPPLLRDIWLELRNQRREKAEIVFANSLRQYENLRISGERLLDYKAAFWGNVGPGLRKLAIDRYNWSSNELYSILQTCVNLESLEIRDPKDLMPKPRWFELPSGKNLGEIQESMRKLRHLQLDLTVNADMLEYFFILMPNLSSIGLSIYRCGSDFLRRLPNMLGTSCRITMLDLVVSDDEGEQLLRISSPSLRTLKYFTYKIIAPKILDALKNCSMLRDLDLKFLIDVRPLQNILRNLPELESLSITSEIWTAHFTQKALMPIFDLRNLRKLTLDLRGSDRYGPVEIVDGLSRMISLESLTLCSKLGIVDSARFRILASMPSLRELTIYCLQWDAECLRIVLLDLNQKLKKLVLAHKTDGDDDSSLRRHWHPNIGRNILTPQERSRFDRQGNQEFPSLEVLETTRIPWNDACVGLISARNSRLKIVRFTDCYHMTCAGLLTLYRHAPLLEELEIGVLDNRGEILGRRFLAELGRRLRSLTVHAVNRISTRSRREFESQRPSVKFIFSREENFYW